MLAYQRVDHLECLIILGLPQHFHHKKSINKYPVMFFRIGQSKKQKFNHLSLPTTRTYDFFPGFYIHHPRDGVSNSGCQKNSFADPAVLGNFGVPTVGCLGSPPKFQFGELRIWEEKEPWGFYGFFMVFFNGFLWVFSWVFKLFF